MAIILAVAGAIAVRVFWLKPSEGQSRPEKAGDRAKMQSEPGKARLQEKTPKSPERKPRAFETRTNKKGKPIKVASGRMTAPADDIYRDDDGRPYPEADQKLLRQADRRIHRCASRRSTHSPGLARRRSWS